MCDNSHGECIPIEAEEWNNTPSMHVFSEGCRSRILYEDAIYQNIIRLHQQAQNDDSRETSTRLCASYFVFAVLLLHELAHACSLARNGNFGEIPFGSREVAETGCDFEHSVLGCTIRIEGIETEPLRVNDWPCPMKIKQYIWDTGIAQYGPIREDNKRDWQLPNPWMLQLFQTSFWDVNVPARGAEALKVPKLLGLRMEGETDCECSRCKTLAWDGRNLKVGQDIRNLPIDSEYVALEPYYVAPHPYHMYPLKGVPKGYALLLDGTLVLRELLPCIGMPEVTSKQLKRVGNDYSHRLVLSDGTFKYEHQTFPDLEKADEPVKPEKAKKKRGRRGKRGKKNKDCDKKTSSECK